MSKTARDTTLIIGASAGIPRANASITRLVNNAGVAAPQANPTAPPQKAPPPRADQDSHPMERRAPAAAQSLVLA